MIMLGSEKKDSAFAELQATPAGLGGITQSPYLVVTDAGAVHDRVVALGGEGAPRARAAIDDNGAVRRPFKGREPRNW